MAEKNHRILVIDDNHAIQDDFRKILAARNVDAGLESIESALFGTAKVATTSYELVSAYQGQEGYEKVLASVQSGRRYALAFVDMRMPPGWDGVQTIEKIWEADPEIQIVICTAYSDYSWEEILARFGAADRLLILKKPFDTAEVCQLACALTTKWHLAKHAYLKLNQLKSMVEERTHELEAANRMLSDEVAERRQSENALRDSEQLYRASFDLAAIGKAHLDPATGRFLKVNRKLCDLTGYSQDKLLEMTVEQLTHAEDRPADEALFRRLIDGENNEYFNELRYVRADARVIWVQASGTVLRDSERRPRNVIALIQDITDRRMAEEQLRHDAIHDGLTHLPNRRVLIDRLNRCLQLARRSGEGFAVLFLDLDHFKVVNDSLGHLVGDQLLVAVAQRLLTQVRALDTVSRDGDGHLVRLGGDEFVVLLERVRDAAEPIKVAERLQGAMAEPFQIDDHELFTRASIGIAMGKPEYTRAEEVLRDADTALYRAKAIGNGSYALFDGAMHEAALARWRMENELRKAIVEGELRLAYQPIISLGSGEVTELEALVRWRRSDGTEVAPGRFIPLAEETGLIIPLGAWVFREACLQLRRWEALPHPTRPITVAVNVSGLQLARAPAVEELGRILQETGTDPDRIRLELTESSIVQNGSAAMAGLDSLHKLGLRFYLDDFGTGYSSLSYLHRLPLDGLKVDRSFTASLGTDPMSRSIVQAIVTLAKTLRIRVIAEGIENEQQLDQVSAMGCESGQGFYFAKPMSADDTLEFLVQTSSRVLLKPGQKRRAG